MIIVMIEKQAGSATQVAKIILENQDHFMRDKERRIALGIVGDEGVEIIEVLSGTRPGFVETRIPLSDFLPAFPLSCRKEVSSMI